MENVWRKGGGEALVNPTNINYSTPGQIYCNHDLLCLWAIQCLMPLTLFLEPKDQKYLVWLFAFLNTISKMDDECTFYLNMLNRWNYHKGIKLVFSKYKKMLEKSPFGELLDIQALGVVNLTGTLSLVFCWQNPTNILPSFCKIITGNSFICIGGGLNSNIFMFARKRRLWNRLETWKFECNFSLSFLVNIIYTH